MAQHSAQASLNGSRLVRVLGELAVSDVEVSHKQFAQRLGLLIDLADSVNLAGVHGRKLADGFKRKTASDDAIKDEFLQVRNSIVASIIASFSNEGGGLRRIKLPQATEQAPDDSAIGFEPYGRFYVAHQREMEAKIQQLRFHVREAVKGATPQLAQLATLDKALADTLAAHSRKCFAVIPRLLSRRYEQLLKEHNEARENPQGSSVTWPELLEMFCRNIHGLLLAEVEARLLPTQGLIEALHSQIDTTPYE